MAAGLVLAYFLLCRASGLYAYASRLVHLRPSRRPDPCRLGPDFVWTWSP